MWYLTGLSPSAWPKPASDCPGLLCLCPLYVSRWQPYKSSESAVTPFSFSHTHLPEVLLESALPHFSTSQAPAGSSPTISHLDLCSRRPHPRLLSLFHSRPPEGANEYKSGLVAPGFRSLHCSCIISSSSQLRGVFSDHPREAFFYFLTDSLSGT